MNLQGMFSQSGCKMKIKMQEISKKLGMFFLKNRGATLLEGNFLNHILALEGCPGCPPQNGRLTTKGERWFFLGRCVEQ